MARASTLSVGRSRRSTDGTQTRGQATDVERMAFMTRAPVSMTREVYTLSRPIRRMIASVTESAKNRPWVLAAASPKSGAASRR